MAQTGANEYLLVHEAMFENGGYERTFYNYIVTDLLFKQANKNEEENKEEHDIRAQAVANKLAKKINSLWPKAKAVSNFNWPTSIEFWGNKGEVDLIIYFPEENTLMLAEIKLSNTLSKRTQRKVEWLHKNIYFGKKSAASQLQKDLDFFKKDAAYPHIAKALGLDPKNKFKPNFKLLILTDTFWIDHTKVECDKYTDEHADCISIYELNNLIEGKINHAVEIENVEEKTCKWLIEAIEKNTFWENIKIPNSIKRDYAVIANCGLTPHKIGLKI